METIINDTVEIIDIYEKNANRELAKRMESYMKNHFSFLGIPKPLRAKLSKQFLKEKTKIKRIDWNFVFQMFEKSEREFQYLAMDYLRKLEKTLQKADIEMLEKLILNKSWWDSVDTLAPLVGALCLKHPELKEEVLANWMGNSNIWLKRVSIIFQLKYRDKTDTDFLKKAILRNNMTKEFFLNKAIGWALRQFSKFNPDWVKLFIASYPLSALSIREGSKYL